MSSFRFLVAACALTVIARAQPAHPWPTEPQFLPVTVERITAAGPRVPQREWRAYLVQSATFAAALPKREAFVTPSVQKLEGPGIPSKHSRGLQLQGEKAWYASEAAQAIADRIVALQSKVGGWTKGNDYTQPGAAGDAHADVWSGGTLDNDATTHELRFLAHTITASPNAAHARAWQDGFLKGVRYLFAAQYPNGGFPQIYPLAGGYHDAITFNDDAMVQALEVLRDIADRKPEFAFVPDDIRAGAGPRVARGVQCILDTQLKDAAGQRTVWCQQHDAVTLQPCAARNFEPVAACTNESASVLRFLMSLPKPTTEVTNAIKSAAGWLSRTPLRDLAWTRQGGVGQLVSRPGAPLLWARMYEIGTDKPIFGDRDRTVHYAVAELSSERRNGYAWYGSWPAAALAEFKRWSAAHP